MPRINEAERNTQNRVLALFQDKAGLDYAMHLYVKPPNGNVMVSAPLTMSDEAIERFVQTKYMTTRWGTCNTKTGKIWLNLQLAKKTPECLEYVILHELVHLVEKTHNERFVSLMDKYMPMWREVKATLNGQTLDYME